MKEDNNFLLFKWLKKQQEKEEQHRDYMAALRNKEDDEHYIHFLKQVLLSRKYNRKELVIIYSLVRWNEDGRNFTDSQRSVIACIYTKYILS